MTDHELMLWTLIVTTIGVLAGSAALVFAWLTIREAQEQAKENAQTAKAEFWIMLRGVFAWYDDIHANFRPQGDWYASKTLPATVQDQARTEVYMGLFEFCDGLLEKQFIDSKDFKSFYDYRLKNIVKNGWVVEKKIIDHRASWLAFINLCYRLGVTIPNVKPLNDEERAKLYPK